MWGAIARIGSRIARPVGHAALQAIRSPTFKTVAGAVGASAAVEGGLALTRLGGSGGGLRPLVGTLPGLGGPATMGDRGIFQNDPNIAEALKGFAISKANLKPFYRAPKGFVVMYDAKGDPYGIPKVIAQKFLGYKAAKKPPITVRDWSALQRSGRVITKLQRIEKTAKKIANWKSPRRAALPPPRKGK